MTFPSIPLHRYGGKAVNPNPSLPASIAPDLASTAWWDIAAMIGITGRKRPTKMQATWMYVNFFEILSALVR